MRNEPYPGMGNVSKAEGLYLKKKRRRMAISIPGGFAMIPIPFLHDPDVTDNDILVYNALATFGSNKISNEIKVSWPLQETVGKVARRCTKVVMRTISHLVKIGWVTKIRRGLTKSNITVLHLYKWQEFTEEQINDTKEAVKNEINRFSRLTGNLVTYQGEEREGIHN